MQPTRRAGWGRLCWRRRGRRRRPRLGRRAWSPDIVTSIATTECFLDISSYLPSSLSPWHDLSKDNLGNLLEDWGSPILISQQTYLPPSLVVFCQPLLWSVTWELRTASVVCFAEFMTNSWCDCMPAFLGVKLFDLFIRFPQLNRTFYYSHKCHRFPKRTLLFADNCNL